MCHRLAASVPGARPATKLRYLLAGAPMLALIALGLWLIWPRPLDYHARQILDALLDGNQDALFDYSAGHEGTETGLTREKYRQLWSRLIAPRLGRLTKVSSTESAVMPPGHQAIAMATFEDARGRRFQVTTEVFQGDRSPECFVMKFLYLAWRMDYAWRNGQPIDSVVGSRPYIEGLLQDRAVLEELGVYGIARLQPTGQQASWDRDLDRWTRNEAARR